MAKKIPHGLDIFDLSKAADISENLLDSESPESAALAVFEYLLSRSEKSKELRDYFAGKAMQGMIFSIRSDEDYYRAKAIAEQKGMTSISQWFAEDAYKQADAMLRARTLGVKP